MARNQARNNSRNSARKEKNNCAKCHARNNSK
jgi:hypothetical protein